jgi:LmbE family N-acetylglucosaminyl deacetylase
MESFFIPYNATTVLPIGKILVLAPHPDDEVFGCGGAIMQHVAQGNAISVIVVTDGSAAIRHSDSNSHLKYIKIRQQESQQAAQILGYRQLAFWDIADRSLTYNEELLQRLEKIIQEHKITQVYAPSVLEVHPDHYALAMMAVEVVRRCGKNVSLAMYEVGVPLYPNLLLDITPVIKRKQAAINCFNSQLDILDYSDQLQSLNGYRSYTLPATVKAAEAYYIIDGETLQTQPWLRFGYSQQTVVLEEAYQKITQLEKQIAATNHELATVYKSHSWRLTAPLRWLNRCLKRLKN